MLQACALQKSRASMGDGVGQGGKQAYLARSLNWWAEPPTVAVRRFNSRGPRSDNVRNPTGCKPMGSDVIHSGLS
jgi:hypothetical protein